MLSRVKRPVQVLFLLLALVFIGAMLWSQWDELQSYRWQLRPLWLLISAGFVIVSWSLEVAIWQSLLRLVGGGFIVRICYPHLVCQRLGSLYPRQYLATFGHDLAYLSPRRTS